ncbi:hypothetical protein SOM61_08580 [Massilia sp. CFBP9012]|uniref:hypothetical protein n=1 Tax=Massilia sp. CFBP9012 TaxID=3096531 RepID=UPI002A6A133E|nr:hypothetical protein [Massilia sp. CFBP9012]MDY0975016.1 hypothetical protein [Massilia sp. CFBP9012]
MALQANAAYYAALALVTQAVESGVIKLRGVERLDDAEAHGKADAAYLIALIRGLQAELPDE